MKSCIKCGSPAKFEERKNVKNTFCNLKCQSEHYKIGVFYEDQEGRPVSKDIIIKQLSYLNIESLLNVYKIEKIRKIMDKPEFLFNFFMNYNQKESFQIYHRFCLLYPEARKFLLFEIDIDELQKYEKYPYMKNLFENKFFIFLKKNNFKLDDEDIIDYYISMEMESVLLFLIKNYKKMGLYDIISLTELLHSHVFFAYHYNFFDRFIRYIDALIILDNRHFNLSFNKDNGKLLPTIELMRFLSGYVSGGDDSKKNYFKNTEMLRKIIDFDSSYVSKGILKLLDHYDSD